ncbi:MAG: GspE/PulE family protein [Phycisphaerales bacterium]
MTASRTTSTALIGSEGPTSASHDSVTGASASVLEPNGDHNGEPSHEFLALIPHEFARRHLVLSAGSDPQDPSTELLHVADDRPRPALFNVGVRLRRPIRAIRAEAELLAAAIDRAYDRARIDSAQNASTVDVPTHVAHIDGVDDVASALDRAVRDLDQDLLSTQGKAPVVRLVDLVLFEALQRRASDVHVQPLRDRTLVRYRLDGVLHTARTLPPSLAAAVVSRIKVMANLDVAEHRAPQDGRATVSMGGSVGTSVGGSGVAGVVASVPKAVDLRISTLPSTFGERVVIRILDASRSPHLSDFAGLGMPTRIEREYLAQVSRPNGIVLSTGPTGSGKTTTLYATLAWISRQRETRHGDIGSNTLGHAGHSASGGGDLHRLDTEVNIMTIEDPVEYDLSAKGSGGSAEGTAHRAHGLAISQTQVDPHKNLTFSTGLRHILRQDPDVIMVGEIRDTETARIAVQASLTGHLVLSTLHTNDAPSAVTRLLDLDIEPFLVASSLSAVLAQRLVRRTHAECGGRGCALCLGTGYRGRIGLFELLVMDEHLRSMVTARATALDLRARAESTGMRSLSDAGRELVEQGVTTREELERVVLMGDVLADDGPIADTNGANA